MLSEQRDAKAVRRFFKRTIETNGVSEKVVIDKSGANLAGLLWTNVLLKCAHGSQLIEILQIKYLSNIVEQDHRFIKKLTRPMLDFMQGFKSFRSASAMVQGIEVAHMIRKRQFEKTNKSASNNLLLSLDNCTYKQDEFTLQQTLRQNPDASSP